MNQEVKPIGYNKWVGENHKECIICKKPFKRGGKKKFTAKFCSIPCKGIWQKGRSIKGRPKSGKEVYCSNCKKMFYRPACYITLNKNYCSKVCYHIGRIGDRAGEKHPLWKGGTRHKNQLLRTSIQYKNWRTKVFVRDDFTCRKCKQKGGQLEAHHIRSWAKYPKLRFRTKNGETLCKKCHKLTDNYKRNGGKNNNNQ